MTPPNHTSRFAGVSQIIRYNYGQYLAALATVVVLACAARWLVPMANLAPGLAAALQVLLFAGAGLAAWWTLSSLVASWYIYDLSPLRRWNWLYTLADPAGSRWILVHTGLDEAGFIIREHHPASPGLILDTFHPQTMTEPSIRRARAEATTSPDAYCHWGNWPTRHASADRVYFILAAHELRRHSDRLALFREALRSLKPGGNVVLIEHERNLLNFLAFGPGFMHFWPATEWDATASEAGLSLEYQQRIATFITARVYLKGGS